MKIIISGENKGYNIKIRLIALQLLAKFTYVPYTGVPILYDTTEQEAVKFLEQNGFVKTISVAAGKEYRPSDKGWELIGNIINYMGFPIYSCKIVPDDESNIVVQEHSHSNITHKKEMNA